MSILAFSIQVNSDNCQIFPWENFAQISSPHRAVISLQKTWNIANKSFGLTAPGPHPLLLKWIRLFPEQEGE